MARFAIYFKGSKGAAAVQQEAFRGDEMDCTIKMAKFISEFIDTGAVVSGYNTPKEHWDRGQACIVETERAIAYVKYDQCIVAGVYR